LNRYYNFIGFNFFGAIWKGYEKYYIVQINKQLRNNPSAAGHLIRKDKNLSRLKLMKFRRHP